MGRPIQAEGRKAGALLIEQRYRAGDDKQFLRELTQNGIEAGATKIQFGIHWTGVDRDDWGDLPTGVHLHKGRFRLVYYDNGAGMGTKMGVYMAGLLDLDTKDQAQGSLHGNFGQGARVSLLPWNRAGVVIASWSEETPEGQLMWIRYVPASKDLGYYEAATLEWEDDSGELVNDDVAPAEFFPEVINDRPDWLGPQSDGTVGTGTMFLLLGNTGQEHTFLGPEGSWNNYTGFVYLSQRYWEHPANLDLRFEDPGTPSIDDWRSRARDRLTKTALDGSTPDSTKRVYNWPVHPQVKVARKYREDGNHRSDNETIDLPDGGRLHVFFATRDESQAFTGRNTWRKPGVAVLYGDELYHRRSDAADYRRFGIGHKNVYQRLTIIVEPRLAASMEDPLGGVFPSGSRTSLNYLPPLDPKSGRPSGRDLPWGVWSEVFHRNMPEFVSKAIADALGSDEDREIDPEIVAQVAAPFMDRWGDVKWVAHENGDTPGTKQPSPRKRRGRRPPEPTDRPRKKTTSSSGEADEHGTHKGILKPTKADLPRCRIYSEVFSEQEREAKPRQGVLYIPSNGAGDVYIDPAHPVIAEVFEHWAQRYADHDRAKVEGSVKTVYEIAMACRVGQILRYGKEAKMAKSELEASLLSTDALTASLFGLASEDAAIKQRTSGLKRIS